MPSVARTVRKLAGTETRPFASILFVAFDRNRDMTRDFRFRDDDPIPRSRYALEKTKILSASPCICTVVYQPPGLVFTYGKAGFTLPLNSAYLGYHGQFWASMGECSIHRLTK